MNQKIFSRLARNTFYTTVAFGISSVITLLLIPVMLAEYGVEGLGLIMLARLFLPSGFAAVFDFGASEIATQVTAEARRTERWAPTVSRLTVLFGVLSVLSATYAVALFAFREHIADLLGVSAENRAEFQTIVSVTALATVPLFLGTMAEGAVKGFERYEVLRATEVLATFGFAVAAVMATRMDADFHTVAIAFVCSQLIKALVFALVSLRWFLRTPARLERPDRAAAGEVVRRGWVMTQSRLLGTLQNQSQLPLIGILIGPEGAGVYEILARPARMLKIVLSNLNSALLPVSAGFRAQDDKGGMNILARAGVLTIPALIYLPLAALAATAPSILWLWLGPEYAYLGPWMSLMLLIPYLNTVLSFNQTVLLVDLKAVKTFNTLLLLQVALSTAISISLHYYIGVFGFVLGQTVAACLLFAFQMRQISRFHAITASTFFHRLLMTVLAGLPIYACGAILFWPGSATDSLVSLAACACASLVSLLVLFLLVLTPGEKAFARRIFLNRSRPS